MILAQVARITARLPFLARGETVPLAPDPYLVETRKALTQVLEYLAVVDAKLAALEAAPQMPPVPTADEIIAQAETATAVYKALEPELQVDRRTILARVERIVLAHSLVERFPNWSRDVKLAKYLAERAPDGRRRIQVATEALG